MALTSHFHRRLFINLLLKTINHFIMIGNKIRSYADISSIISVYTSLWFALRRDFERVADSAEADRDLDTDLDLETLTPI